MSENILKYKKLCDSELSIPIFSQYWWLDSLCPGKWDVILIEKNEEIVATMPYVLKRKGPFLIQSTPILTQSLGPWIRYPDQMEASKRVGYEHELLKQIIDQFPKSHMAHVPLHHTLKNWLPFYWKGFSGSTRYTYLVEDLKDLDEVFSRFDPKMRNKVRKAEKLVRTIHSDDVSKFYDINEKTFLRQKLPMPYSKKTLAAHDAILNERNARKIFFAEDKDGNTHSALYLTWDKMSSYVHMVGESPELRSSGAGIKLIWDAITFTKDSLGLDCLDFEGSMIESVERVRRNCGGVPHPYFEVKRIDSRILGAWVKLSEYFRGV